MSTSVMGAEHDQAEAPLTRRLRWMIYAVVILSYGLVLAASFTMPLSSDEAYNLQVPLHLAEHHRYATDGTLYGEGSSRPFDAFISTGPTLLAPIGLLFAVFGEHLWIARAVACAAFLGLAAGLWHVGRRLGGTWCAAVAVLALLMVNYQADWPDGSGWPNYMILGPGDVLGEMTAAAFIVWSALMLPRMRTAGALLGLAILTKVLAVLVVPAFWLAVLLVRGRRPARRQLLEVFVFTGFVALPIVAWQAIRLAALGRDEFGVRVYEFLAGLFLRGSGLGDSRTGAGHARLMVLIDSTMLPVVTALTVITVLVVALLVPRSREAPIPSDVRRRALVIGLGGSAASIFAWWLLAADLPWSRHLMIALVILIPLAIVGLTRLALSSSLSWLPAVLMTVVAVQAVIHGATAFEVPGESLDDQREVARFLAPRSTLVRHMESWPNPELRFLGGIPSRSVADEGGLLVVSPRVLRRLPPESLRRALDLCDRVVARKHGYLVCWASRASGPPSTD